MCGFLGFRFRKSVKIAPGIKLNVGKKSAGISIGGKYGGISVNSKSGARARVSAPGTGLSYTTKISSSKAHSDSKRLLDLDDYEEQYEFQDNVSYDIADQNELRSLSYDEFQAWSKEFLKWAENISQETDRRTFDFAQEQVRIIQEERARRAEVRKRGDKFFKINIL